MTGVTFEEFVGERGPGLRAALVAAYGPQVFMGLSAEFGDAGIPDDQRDALLQRFANAAERRSAEAPDLTNRGAA